MYTPNTIIVDLFSLVDQALNQYVYRGYNAMVGLLKIPLGLAVVLFIILMGLSISQGWVKLSMSNFIKAALKIGLIYTFAMHWSYFSEYVVDGLSKSASFLGNALIQASPMPIPHSGSAEIQGAIQYVFNLVTKIGGFAWEKGGIGNLAFYITALIIWGFGYIVVLMAIFEILLAKMMLAVLFSLAPLFISFTLYKPTHSFFDHWLGSAVGYAFVLIFVAAVLALDLNLCYTVLAAYQDKAHFQIFVFIPLMVVCFFGAGILLEAASIAHRIGGSMRTLSGSSFLAGFIGGAITGGSLAGGAALSVGSAATSAAATAGSAAIGATVWAASKTKDMVNFLKTKIRR